MSRPRLRTTLEWTRTHRGSRCIGHGLSRQRSAGTKKGAMIFTLLGSVGSEGFSSAGTA
jgi:hypothetical protein